MKKTAASVLMEAAVFINLMLILRLLPQLFYASGGASGKADSFGNGAVAVAPGEGNSMEA